MMDWNSDEVKRQNICAYADEADRYDGVGVGRGYLPSLDVERIKDLIDISKTGSRILEIGAGTGYGWEACRDVAQPGLWVAADISKEMIIKYKNNSSEPFRALAVVADAEYLPFKDGTFDFVICFSMIHHLPDDDGLLAEASQVTNDQGALAAMRAPNMDGCDFWMRVLHLPKRYGDRKGLMMLLRLIASGPGGWKRIWSYEMGDEAFRRPDLQEIRGAILHATRTKKRGGIDPGLLHRRALKYFPQVFIRKYGLIYEMLNFFSILFNWRFSMGLLVSINRIDVMLNRTSIFLPYSSLALVCRKADMEG